MALLTFTRYYDNRIILKSYRTYRPVFFCVLGDFSDNHIKHNQCIFCFAKNVSNRLIMTAVDILLTNTLGFGLLESPYCSDFLLGKVHKQSYEKV